MIQAKKSLGQNFLKSPHILNDIVVAGGVTADNTILEIGPGEGSLTAVLLATGAKVIAVEKDDRLIPILSDKFPNEIASGKLTLIHDDILLLEISHLNIGEYKLIANIPYYITGQIIRNFLESKKQPASITLLVQKEVADRIVTRDKKESLLSLSIKAYGIPTYVRTVGKGAFTPSPSVDSAVIHIKNISKNRFNGVKEKDFFDLIHAGFAHKRKQLLPNLSVLYPKEKLLSAFEKTGIDIHGRAEDISIDTWFSLLSNLK